MESETPKILINGREIDPVLAISLGGNAVPTENVPKEMFLEGYARTLEFSLARRDALLREVIAWANGEIDTPVQEAKKVEDLLTRIERELKEGKS